jgi:hypothetical protein
MDGWVVGMLCLAWGFVAITRRTTSVWEGAALAKRLAVPIIV